MADRVRIEIGFDGGQSLSMLVSPSRPTSSSDGIGEDGSVTLDAEDARYIVALRRVVYLRRFRREATGGVRRRVSAGIHRLMPAAKRDTGSGDARRARTATTSAASSSAGSRATATRSKSCTSSTSTASTATCT